MIIYGLYIKYVLSDQVDKNIMVYDCVRKSLKMGFIKILVIVIKLKIELNYYFSLCYVYE